MTSRKVQSNLFAVITKRKFDAGNPEADKVALRHDKRGFILDTDETLPLVLMSEIDATIYQIKLNKQYPGFELTVVNMR